MNLQGLVLKHFYCYENVQVNFQKNGIYTIYGENKKTGDSNGIGKSAIKDAVKFAVYGKTRMDSLDDIIQNGFDEVSVQCIFSLDNDLYKVKRSRKRAQSTKVQLYKREKKNWVELKFNKNSDTQNTIEELIGVPYDLFMYSFCFGEGDDFDDLRKLTANKLIDLMKQVLMLERFNTYQTQVKTLYDKNEAKLNRLTGQKEVCSKLYNQFRTSEVLSKRLKKVQQYHNQTLKDWKEVKDNLDVLITKIVTVKQEKSKCESRMQQLKKEIKSLETGVCSKCGQSLSDDRVLKETQNALYKIMTANQKELKELVKLSDKRKQLEQKIEPLDKVISRTTAILHRIEYLQKDLVKQTDVVFDEKEYKKCLRLRGVLSKAVEVFSNKGLPLHILNTYIPKIELATNQELQKLGNFKLEMRTQKKLRTSDKYKSTLELVFKKGNRECSLKSLSEGQRFLVALAVRIGLSRVLHLENPFDTLFIDEGFGKLSKRNQQRVKSLFNGLTDTFKKIVIISHVEEIEKWDVAHKVFIEMDNDVSKILEVS